jgi:hypothetical protein
MYPCICTNGVIHSARLSASGTNRSKVVPFARESLILGNAETRLAAQFGGLPSTRVSSISSAVGARLDRDQAIYTLARPTPEEPFAVLCALLAWIFVDARAIPENGFDDDSRRSPSAEVTSQAGLRWLRLGGGGLLLRFQEDERRGLGL